METLSGVDTTWLRMEKPDNPLTVLAVLWFDEPMGLDELKAKLEADLLPFRRFRQRVVGADRPIGRPSWEDDPDFSLDRHVRAITLDAPTEEALQARVDDLLSDQLDATRPLWDAHLVNGTGGPGNALIVRIHHSLADGFSLILLMMALLDADCDVALPGGIVPPRLRPGRPLEGATEERPHPGLLEALRSLHVPHVGLAEARQAGEAAACAGRLLAMSPDSATSLRGPLGMRKLGRWTRPIPLDAVKRLSRQLGGTINDVLLATLAGACRRVLADRSEPVDGIEIRVIVPVNVRPFETRTDALGNGFGLVFVELPAGLSTSDERLSELKRRMDGIKESPEAMVVFALLRAGGHLPKSIYERLLDQFAGKSTAVVTNVPGPTTPIRLAGKNVVRQVFFAPQSAGTGIGVSIFSYCGSITVGVSADRNLLDPADLIAAYEREIESLGVTV